MKRWTLLATVVSFLFLAYLPAPLNAQTKDTLVVGHYTAEEWDDQRQAWWPHDGLNIFISVDVS